MTPSEWAEIDTGSLTDEYVVMPYNQQKFQYVFTTGDGHCGYYAYLFGFLKNYANQELPNDVKGNANQFDNRKTLIKEIVKTPPKVDEFKRMEFPSSVVNKLKELLIEKLIRKTPQLEDLNDKIKDKNSGEPVAEWAIDSENIDLTNFHIKNKVGGPSWTNENLMEINNKIDEIRSTSGPESRETRDNLNLFMLIIINDGSNDGQITDNIMTLLHDCFGIPIYTWRCQDKYVTKFWNDAVKQSVPVETIKEFFWGVDSLDDAKKLRTAWKLMTKKGIKDYENYGYATNNDMAKQLARTGILPENSPCSPILLYNTGGHYSPVIEKTDKNILLDLINSRHLTQPQQTQKQATKEIYDELLKFFYQRHIQTYV